jgi:hypothetical protein
MTYLTKSLILKQETVMPSKNLDYKPAVLPNLKYPILTWQNLKMSRYKIAALLHLNAHVFLEA